MTTFVLAAASGVLFALGLVVSGMTAPANVIGFLDITGARGPWAPALAFVMASAIAVHAPLARRIRGRRAPLFGGTFHLPPHQALDVPLIAGAAVFGIGWGLSGYCPGPVLVSAGTGAPGVLVFVAALLAGTRAARWLQAAGAR